jgi:rhamnogalacturonan acetylesterase
MKLLSVISIALLELGALALPGSLDTRAGPTIYAAGDSTMAAKGANNGLTDG